MRSVASTSMFSTSRVSQSPGGTQAAAARGGQAAGADFQAALADAVGAQEGAASAGGARQHVVKPGETLYGIARARLAAAGQAATPGASMRHALEIAQANDIRNPDRLRAGQQLVLAPTTAPIPATSNAATAGAGRIAPTDPVALGASSDDAARLRIIQGFETQAEIAAADPSPEVDEITCDASACPSAVSELALPGNIAGQEGKRGEVNDVVAARADLSLYAKSAPAPASKPPAELPDIVYKGVLGKALDWVPLEPETRTGLQQANAVVSSSIVARSIAAATGIGGPILTIVGLVWGIFSARKISAMQAQANEPQPVARRDITARLTE